METNLSFKEEVLMSISKEEARLLATGNVLCGFERLAMQSIYQREQANKKSERVLCPHCGAAHCVVGSRCPNCEETVERE
jgi:hypothetical protein